MLLINIITKFLSIVSASQKDFSNMNLEIVDSYIDPNAFFTDILPSEKFDITSLNDFEFEDFGKKGDDYQLLNSESLSSMHSLNPLRLHIILAMDIINHPCTIQAHIWLHIILVMDIINHQRTIQAHLWLHIIVTIKMVKHSCAIQAHLWLHIILAMNIISHSRTV